MKNFIVKSSSSSARIVFGRDCVIRCGVEEIKKLGKERIVVIASNRSISLPSSKQLLDDLGERIVGMINELKEHIPYDFLVEMVDKVLKLRADALLVIGGGSPLGLAKALVPALMVDGDTAISIISIPTTYSGSEVTGIYGITKTFKSEKGVQVSRKVAERNEHVRPRLVLYDSSLLHSLPYKMAVPSLFNAMAHAVEALWAPQCTPLSYLYSVECLKKCFRYLPVLKMKRHDRSSSPEEEAQAVDNLLYAAYLAGTALDNEEMALQHRLAHVLGGRFHLPHAETHMTILPHCIAFNLAALPEGAVHDIIQTDDLAGAVYDLQCFLLGAPPNLVDIGFDAQYIDACADDTIEILKGSNPVAVSKESLRELLRRASRGQRPTPPSDQPLFHHHQLCRIPYLNNDEFAAQDQEAAAKILERRAGELLNLDRSLMHAPRVAEGWNAMFGALRGSLSLDGRSREMVILRIAIVNRAYYEFFQHYDVFLKEGGTVPQAMALGRWRYEGGLLFSERDRAILAYVDEMTQKVQVSNAVADAVKQVLEGSKGLVELTALCAGYNMCARFLEGLRLGPEREVDLPPMPRNEL